MAYHQRAHYQPVATAALLTQGFTTLLAGAAARTMMVLVIIGLLGAYVAQISSLMSGGYQIAELDQKRALLLDENEKLRSEIASHQAMTSITGRLEERGMIKAERIIYIKTGNGPVAKK